MKKYAISILLLIVLICVGITCTFNKVRYLAADANHIPDFFELKSDNQFTCIDELHSQGRNFEDFGSAHYVLRIKDGSNIRETVRHNENVTETDTSLIIKIRRGDIDGTLVLMKNSQIAYIHYNQIYDD